MVYVKKICKIPNCERTSRGKGLCYTHLKEFYPNILRKLYDSRNAVRKCSVEGCGKQQQRKKLCMTHLKEQYPEIWKDRRVAHQEWFDTMYSIPELKKQYATRLAKNHKSEALQYRKIVFDHYSNNDPKCYCCGESHEEFLTLEHPNGRAPDERLTGYKFYRWLIVNKFPYGYLVYCYNCNCAKGRLGYCPHQKKELAI